jgi:hypothetical protein
VSTAQVTPVLELPVTVAEKTCVCLLVIADRFGEMDTMIPEAGVIAVTVEE